MPHDESRQRRRTDSALILRSVLEKLKNLDLTGKLRIESAVMKTYGGYADVFLGYILSGSREQENSIKVAIKRLRVHLQGDLDFAMNLAKEIRVWSRLHHPNVLVFLGYALEGGEYPLLVSEWMQNGTAISYVHQNPDCDILQMVLGIAEGLAYLHSQGVVHADLKADNVLVSDRGQPRICDFGISSVRTASTTFGVSSHGNGAKGSLRWMAPELFEIVDPPVMHSEMTDVWAFGMTLYELLAKQVPYAHLKRDPQVLLAIMNLVLPSIPDSVAEKAHVTFEGRLWDLCCDCWQRDPSARPHMRGIVQRIKSIQLLAPSDISEGKVIAECGNADECLLGSSQAPEPPLNAEKHNEVDSANLRFTIDSEYVSSPLSTHSPQFPVLESESPRDIEDNPTYFSSPMSGSTAVGTPFFRSPRSEVFDDRATISSFGTVMEETVIKEGYLAEVTDGPVYRLYTTKYFVLHPSSLKYYRTKDGELLGTFNVTGAQLLDQLPYRTGCQSPFLLITQRSMGLSNESSLDILYANSRSECEEWVSALQYTAKGLDNWVPSSQKCTQTGLNEPNNNDTEHSPPPLEANCNKKRISGLSDGRLMSVFRRAWSRSVG